MLKVAEISDEISGSLAVQDPKFENKKILNKNKQKNNNNNILNKLNLNYINTKQKSEMAEFAEAYTNKEKHQVKKYRMLVNNLRYNIIVNNSGYNDANASDLLMYYHFANNNLTF